MTPDRPGAPDPVLARRDRIAGWVRLGQRFGTGLLVLAIVLFGIGMGVGFNRPIAAAITTTLAAASLVLAPAIVFGFAVRAAQREERRPPR